MVEKLKSLAAQLTKLAEAVPEAPVEKVAEAPKKLVSVHVLNFLKFFGTDR